MFNSGTSATSTQSLVETVLEAAQTGVFAIRIGRGGAFVKWKTPADLHRTLLLVREARHALHRLIGQQSTSQCTGAEIRLAHLIDEGSGLDLITPLDELRRRHTAWLMVVRDDGYSGHLDWSGDLITCLGLATYAEQILMDLRR